MTNAGKLMAGIVPQLKRRFEWCFTNLRTMSDKNGLKGQKVNPEDPFSFHTLSEGMGKGLSGQVFANNRKIGPDRRVGF